ncbi:8-amino-3,8-dideoxy-manno-octulosonate cytidylyltransferase KdsB [Shewanella frigidimarina]|jgi:3-deoxy-manno-octulosonate cytidylyltransferase (CMP-KDO synthetase)|uniref:8-amino-3,8-dideoxy-manno-octulosonate cytidylyltransferase n=1 Tax=Shewanella frigidimarina (strain NCIMB 400) TaxID=318167 RepID=KDSB_SHEFN|nr:MULTISPECIES: 8-amino-3,8-dideoxy-manno-octulosonate cytidylyltransferase KdsB [Shewanella]Q083F6.1 RecName: Full=8-amino-3,8-dideoxy-manno-octulosonate cytidylyltransferase; AltName: Full=CMP-8-amino-3,8-dideoxy-manno-octulosonate synthase [Shewanella frigidimarina NCIMB 400]ABI71609.1 3-deoxy-D-manno-octulosonate cytidylyltransferase [Shewanella frigidimarina NCIMB 400]MBB1426512.1 3-deoxy-manno-octulosonate cytidylyltransferase [Shewanella sp. SG44-2]RPA32680.1 3-deoxy-manno-octulosonate |tara:strand:+ start:401 stop:1138 length:738 start_codon:yes stop_codon:yes gene_type:complete
MKVTLLIPARYGSSRFPGKPLAPINGKPMIQHVYERASLAKGLDSIYVATDDDRIKDAVESFGGKVVMTSPDAASGTDRINDAIALLGLNDDDLVINLQGDQPLIDPISIEQIISLFERHPGEFEMATLGFEIVDKRELDDPMHVKMVFDNDHNALYFSRSRIPFGRDTNDYPVYKHLGVYAYTKRFVNAFAKLPLGRLEDLEKLEQLRALEYGHKIKIAISAFDSPEVDTPEDIRKCELRLAVD